MKTFEVKIKKTRTVTECGMEWPAWWNEVYQRVDVVAYEDHPDQLGLREEGAVCVCDDKTWETIAAKKDKVITELTETTANKKGRAWRPQVIMVTDEQAVLLATAKAALGVKLTDDDRKTLDPNAATPGVNKSKLFDIAKIAVDRGDTLSEASL